MLDGLYLKPNRILEKQRAVQNDPRPIMYRLPRSRLYLGLYGTGFTVAMFGTVYGIASLIQGKAT